MPATAIRMAARAVAPVLANDNEPAQRLAEAAAVDSEIMAAPDKGIPEDLLTDAHCVVIVPGLNTAAFAIGAKFGKGYVSCRKSGGVGWSAPENRQGVTTRVRTPNPAAKLVSALNKYSSGERKATPAPLCE